MPLFLHSVFACPKMLRKKALPLMACFSHFETAPNGADRAATSRENPVPSTAPNQYNPNRVFQIGNGFGFFLTFHYDYFENGRRRRASSKRRTRSSAITKKFRQSLIIDSDGIFLMLPLTDFPVPRAPCPADVYGKAQGKK